MVFRSPVKFAHACRSYVTCYDSLCDLPLVVVFTHIGSVTDRLNILCWEDTTEEEGVFTAAHWSLLSLMYSVHVHVYTFGLVPGRINLLLVLHPLHACLGIT